MTHRAEAHWEIVDGVGAAAGRNAHRRKAHFIDVLELSHPSDLRDIASLGPRHYEGFVVQNRLGGSLSLITLTCKF